MDKKGSKKYPSMEGIRVVQKKPQLKPKIKREVFDDLDFKFKTLRKQKTLRLNEKLKKPADSLLKPKDAIKYIDQINQTNSQITLPNNQNHRIDNRSILEENARDIPDPEETEQTINYQETGTVTQKKLSAQATLLIFGAACATFFFIIGITKTYNTAKAAKDNAYTEAISASKNLEEASSALQKGDLEKSQENFKAAEENFLNADKEIDSIGIIPKQLIKMVPYYGGLVRSGENTLKSGYHLTLSAQNLLKFSEPIINDGQKNFIPDNYEGRIDPKNSLTTKLTNNQYYLKEGISEIKKANSYLEKVSVKKIPGDFQKPFEELQNNLPLLEEKLEGLDKNFPMIMEMLGSKETRYYLILFQNNTEMRATGGFIGSYGILQIHQGKIRKIFVDNVYNPDGIMGVKVSSPKPFQKVHIGRWKMRDANWSPDFPTAAEKVAWFYEKGGGPNVDGVIATTPSFIQDLLKITGSVNMGEYDTKLSAKNFVRETQKQVDVVYTDKSNPKEFLIDFAPKMIAKLIKQTENWSAFGEIINKNIQEKHFLAFSYKKAEQDWILKNNLGGEIKATEKNEDYLSVINSNLSGNKSSAVMTESITNMTEIKKDGEIIRTVTIKRKHSGKKLLAAGPNKDYMRVIVPQGSVLLESSAKMDEIDVNTEKNKTIFGTWVITKVKKTSEITFKYRLPFKLKPSIFKPVKKYSLYLQKQSGSIGSKIENIIVTEDNLKIDLLNDTDDKASLAKYSDVLNKDRKVIGLIRK